MLGRPHFRLCPSPSHQQFCFSVFSCLASVTWSATPLSIRNSVSTNPKELRVNSSWWKYLRLFSALHIYLCMQTHMYRYTHAHMHTYTHTQRIASVVSSYHSLSMLTSTPANGDRSLKWFIWSWSNKLAPAAILMLVRKFCSLHPVHLTSETIFSSPISSVFFFFPVRAMCSMCM